MQKNYNEVGVIFCSHFPEDSYREDICRLSTKLTRRDLIRTKLVRPFCFCVCFVLFCYFVVTVFFSSFKESAFSSNSNRFKQFICRGDGLRGRSEEKVEAKRERERDRDVAQCCSSDDFFSFFFKSLSIPHRSRVQRPLDLRHQVATSGLQDHRAFSFSPHSSGRICVDSFHQI